MAYPPSPLPTDATDGTSASDTTPTAVLTAAEVNATNAAVNDIVAELGSNPSGTDATVGARLDGIEADVTALGSGSIPDGSVSTAKLADGAVTAAKLAATAVTPGAYTAADITVDAQGRITSAANGAGGGVADGSVTTAKLADGAVTAAKVAADVATQAELDAETAARTAAIAGLSGTYAPLAPLWVSGRAYVVGEIVLSGGILYRCATAHTSGASFAAGNFALVSGGGATVDTTDVGYDVILLVGQSNMVGLGTGSADTYKDPVDARIWRWVASESTATALASYKAMITVASEPLGHPETSTTTPGVGPGLSFARWYARSIPTNRAVLLVPAAVGGTPLTPSTGTTWNSAVTGSLFDAAVALATAAINAAGANARMAAIVWLQGETDALGNILGPTYRIALDALISAFRARLPTATAATPFIVGQMPPNWTAVPHGTSVPIAAVHAGTTARVSYTGYATGPAQSTTDVHYTADEARTIGRSLFIAYLAARTNVLSQSVAGQPTDLTPTPGVGLVALAWSEPSNVGVPSLTDYLVEYRLSGTGAWSTFSHTASPTPSINVTGLTNNQAYDFRVSAVNAAGTGTASATATATPVAAFSPLTAITWQAAYWASDPAWSSPADGAAVSSWRDGSGNARTLTQDTGGNRPVFTGADAGLNGQPVVAFTASSPHYLSAAAFSVAQPYSFVAIIDGWVAGAGGARLIFSSNPLSQMAYSGTGIEIWSGNAWVSVASSGTTTGRLLAGVFNGASSKTFVGGVLTTTGNAGANGFGGGLYVGAQNGGSNSSTVKVAFIGIFAGDITADANWTAFKNWAATTYGISVS